MNTKNRCSIFFKALFSISFFLVLINLVFISSVYALHSSDVSFEINGGSTSVLVNTSALFNFGVTNGVGSNDTIYEIVINVPQNGSSYSYFLVNQSTINISNVNWSCFSQNDTGINVAVIICNTTTGNLTEGQSLDVWFDAFTPNKIGNFTWFLNTADNVSYMDSNTVVSTLYDNILPVIQSLAVNRSVNIYENITIIANVTDNINVSYVWAEINYDFQNTSFQSIINLSDSGGLWVIDYNVSVIGEYDIVLYGVDTSGNVISDSEWFEAYFPLHFLGNISEFQNVSSEVYINFTFYRPGTSKELYSIISSNTSYNDTARKAVYDIVISVLHNGQSYLFSFYDVNLTESANIKGGDGASEIIDSVYFDNVSIDNIDISDNVSYLNYTVSAILSKNYFEYSSVKISMGYMHNSNITGGDNPKAIEFFECSSWNVSSEYCIGSWNILVSSVNITSGNIVSGNITNASFQSNVSHMFVISEPKTTTLYQYPSEILGNYMSSKLYLYRPGTNFVDDQLVYNFSFNSSSANISDIIYSRGYDVLSIVTLQTINDVHRIKFNNMDFFNFTSNITNPLYLQSIYNNISLRPSLSEAYLPDVYTDKKLIGLAFSSDRPYDNSSIYLNFSNNPFVQTLKTTIFECPLGNCLLPFNDDWLYDIIWVSKDTVVDSINKIIFTYLGGNNLTFSSAFVVSQETTSSQDKEEVPIVPPYSSGGSKSYCGDRVCGFGEDGINCPEDCAVCGNRVCEPGEELTCIDDCYTTYCGNYICETDESKQNCPMDCLIGAVSVNLPLSEIVITPGSKQIFNFTILNNMDEKIYILRVTASKNIEEFVSFKSVTQSIDNKSKVSNILKISVPIDAVPGVYSGNLIFDADGKMTRVPISLFVSVDKVSLITMSMDLLPSNLNIEEEMKIQLTAYNNGYMESFELTLIYNVKKIDSDDIFASFNSTMFLKSSNSTIQSFSIPDFGLPEGNYVMEIYALYNGEEIGSTFKSFNVFLVFWTKDRIMTSTFLLFSIILGGGMWYVRKWFAKRKKDKARYVFPLDYTKLPMKSERALSIGKIAETDIKAWYNPDDITTHMLVAGSTGSGKSVTASIFVEEALLKKIPVVIFDPTSQWTGFVKACKDVNLTSKYADFNMNLEDAKPFKGMIFDVDSPDVEVDFKKYMNPGEVTVFNLNKLGPGEYDQAVMKIVDTIFAMHWDESPEMRLLIVFDEVHRLLEKYGGKGGYIALEKACREFRKWGIGLIMVSQVSADFKEAVAGNILSEIQLNTKSMEDINKIKSKYGEEFARRISREAIGTAMIQNPHYNDGKPWFVSFRPTLHSPHKIPEEDLNQYYAFAKVLEALEKDINDLEAKGIDVSDILLELKLAKDKLKEGRFRMAEIYINTLKDNVLKLQKK
ncbi:MAG: DUF87 domain-containing protein [DPANN group archaeon]|nr:DUF87 domain-containing protein [DPANN group archaeon]